MVPSRLLSWRSAGLSFCFCSAHGLTLTTRSCLLGCRPAWELGPKTGFEMLPPPPTPRVMASKSQLRIQITAFSISECSRWKDWWRWPSVVILFDRLVNSNQARRIHLKPCFKSAVNLECSPGTLSVAQCSFHCAVNAPQAAFLEPLSLSQRGSGLKEGHVSFSFSSFSK